MISFRHKGDFSKADRYFEKLKESAKIGVLDKYGRAGVKALASATPKDTGNTANSWYYEIVHEPGSDRIIFSNTNRNDGVLIAIILQYGHGTGTGGWVEGIDYINPAIQPIFNNLVDEVWEEVTRI